MRLARHRGQGQRRGVGQNFAVALPPSGIVLSPLFGLPLKENGQPIAWDLTLDKPAEDLFNFRTVPNNTGTVFTVNSDATWSTAVTNSQRGDIIKITAGTVLNGMTTMPAKSGTGVVLIQPDDAALAALPAAGSRIRASDAANMYTIRNTVANGRSIEFAASANGYRFIGAIFTNTSGVFNDDAQVNMNNNWTSKTTCPNNIVFDRCWFKGDPNAPSKRGIAIGGTNIAVTECRFTDFWNSGADTQAIWFLGYSRRVHINNNYLDGDGETIMLGGSDQPFLDGSLVDTLPADIIIAQNEFHKIVVNLANQVIKNMLEVKYGERGVVWGNVFHGYRVDGQSVVFFFVTNNQGGTATYADHTRTQNWTVRSNKIYDCDGYLFQVAQHGDSPQVTTGTRYIEFSYNLAYDYPAGGDVVTSRAFMAIDCGLVPDITFRNNTIIGRSNMIYGISTLSKATYLPLLGHRIYNNIFGTNATYGFYFNSLTPNEMNDCFGTNNWTLAYNLSVNNAVGVSGGTPDNTGTNKLVTSQAAILFTDAANFDYSLQSGSPAKNAGSDGKDMGAHIATLNTNTTGVVTG